MYSKIVVLLGLLIGANASGEISILRVPSAVQFKGSEPLPATSYYDLFAACLGRYTEYDTTWNGAYLTNPFEPATAVVAVLINGISDSNNDAKYRYPLSGTPEPSDLTMLAARIQTQGGEAVTLDMSDDVTQLMSQTKSICNIKAPTYEKQSVSALKPQVNAEDKFFVQQLAYIDQLTTCLKSLKQLPELTTINIDITPMLEKHDSNSAARAEAMKMLSAAIDKLAVVADEVSKGTALVVSTANKEDISARSKRQAKQETSADSLNLALEYSSSYPVIFNIILWFGVAMFLSLIAICHVIGTMDPGRDSIIYRMTSTRMKKDN